MPIENEEGVVLLRRGQLVLLLQTKPLDVLKDLTEVGDKLREEDQSVTLSSRDLG